jgi:hypothetical protein
MKKIFVAVIGLFSSYGMACVILVLLCLLTYLGTIAQVDIGLFEAQKRYFTSWLVLHPLHFGSAEPLFPVPLPGVMLLMALFSVNLILGALMRLRRRPSHVGLFIVHGGILILLLGGLITHAVAIDGQMTLAPGEASNRFQSYYEWELAAIDSSPADHVLEYTVPQSQLIPLHIGRTRAFQFEQLPFEIHAGPYFRNARITPEGPMFEAPTPAVDGFFAQPLELDPQIEANMPAVYVTLIDKQTGEQRAEILWGRSALPLDVEYGGRTYQIALRHTTWSLPFSIRLKEFTRELHPGTQQPRAFESDVVKLEPGGRDQNITIRMNEPLRTEGYVFFQASFSPIPGSDEFASTFAVAKNPADKFPLYACVIITVGMLVHFGASLIRYLRRQKEQSA